MRGLFTWIMIRLGVIILKIVEYALIACLIGVMEEIFFRGFLLQSFMENMSVPMAVFVCSLIFSVLHFFRADVFVSTGFQPFVGFVTMAQFFKPLFFDLAKHLPEIIGLFLVGVVLSYAFIKTKITVSLHRLAYRDGVYGEGRHHVHLAYEERAGIAVWW